jgi:hypothetical protein
MSVLARATILVVALLVVGGLCSPQSAGTRTAGTDTQSEGSTSIYVAATGSYSYTPDTFQDLPTNSTINVTFVDNSTMTDPHTFTIIGEEGVQLSSSTSQAEINRLSFGHNPSPLFNLNVSPSNPKNVSWFESPGPGWYEFVCSQSSHFSDGMYGFIAFGMNLPSNLTLPNETSISLPLTFNLVDAGIVTAFVVVLALAVVLWHRQSSRARSSQGPKGRSQSPPRRDW